MLFGTSVDTFLVLIHSLSSSLFPPIQGGRQTLLSYQPNDIDKLIYYTGLAANNMALSESERADYTLLKQFFNNAKHQVAVYFTTEHQELVNNFLGTNL